MLALFDDLLARVEQCKDKLGGCYKHCDAGFPAAQLLLYEASARLAKEAGVEELLGNLKKSVSLIDLQLNFVCLFGLRFFNMPCPVWSWSTHCNVDIFAHNNDN